MSFKRVSVPIAGETFRPLGAGEVSVAKTGVALFRREDLELVGIKDGVALLVDAGNLRVAIRKPRLPADDGCVARVVPARRNGKQLPDRAHVNLAAAVRAAGLTVRAVGGARYPLTTKDDLLIIGLVDVGSAPGTKAKAKGKP